MVKSVAALLALICFAGAHVAGVLANVSPMTRLTRSFVALVLGLAGGVVCGLVLQRIVLARLSQELPAPEEES